MGMCMLSPVVAWVFQNRGGFTPKGLMIGGLAANAIGSVLLAIAGFPGALEMQTMTDYDYPANIRRRLALMSWTGTIALIAGFVVQLTAAMRLHPRGI